MDSLTDNIDCTYMMDMKSEKKVLGQLLTCKDNECEDNMPNGVLEFLKCIRNTKG
jgi:hypothetical protein